MRFIVLMIGLGGFVGLASGQDIIEQVKRGDALLAQGRPELALIEYEKALASGAGSAMFLNRLAGLYMQNSSYEKAVSSLQESLGEDPRQIPVYSALGEAFLAQGKVDSAIFYVEQARILAPSSSAVYSSLGFLYLQTGEVERARAELERALELDEKNPEAHRLYGFYYAQKDSIDRAIEHYQRLSELLPEEVEAFNNIGFLYANTQRYNEALEYYKRAKDLAQDPYLAQSIQANLDGVRALIAGKMRARYILVKTMQAARDVLEKLENGVEFSQLAAEFSIAPNASGGGDLGFFGPGELMPEFEEVVVQLEIGTLSQIVEVPMGFIIVERLN